MHKKGIRLILITVAIFSTVTAVLIYYFLFTTKGSSFIANQAVCKYVACEDINIARVSGDLSSSLIMHDIELTDLAGLPQGTSLKIQQLETKLQSFGLGGLNVKIDNGRLSFPDSSTILFYGSYTDSSLDVNAYCQQLYVREFLDLFTGSNALKAISGRISDLDMYIKGTLSEPLLTGTLRIEELSRNSFSMTNCPISFNITLKDRERELKVFGELNFIGGTMSGPKTAPIELQKSKILFSGNPQNPSLALQGTAAIEDIRIYLTLSGSADKPNLQLKSEPPLPEERLLLILMTGKSWKGTELALGQGRISPGLAKDFVDYFFFGSSGSKIAKRFGIDDITFKYDSQKKEVEIKKTISDKLEATYSVEQSQQKHLEPTATHKVGGDYKITDTVSVGAEKELKQDKIDEQGKTQTKDKVFLKYKKEF